MQWAVLQTPEIHWGANGVPFSVRHGDRYHSDDPVGEAQYVFLNATGTPDLFSTRPYLAIAEIGFGSGLNFAVTLEQFLSPSSSAESLTYIGIEYAPWSRTDIQRFFRHLNLKLSLHEPWLSLLPPRAPGRYHIPLRYGNKHIDLFLVQMDAMDALTDFAEERRLVVDVWYHDGFAPNKNPDLWTPELFAKMAMLSANGARYSTFTAAGSVRRALIQAGFYVEKRNGFGQKREMLVARLSTPVVQEQKCHPPPGKHIAVVGNGIAGTLVAHELTSAGHSVSHFGPKHRAICASANPAGLVVPRLERTWSLNMLWHIHSFAYAATYYSELPDNLASLTRIPYQQQRRPLDEATLTKMFLDPQWLSIDDRMPNRLWFERAWRIFPKTLLEWLQARLRKHPNYEYHVKNVPPKGLSSLASQFDAVVLCVGAAAKQFAPHVAWQAVRGQIDVFSSDRPISVPAMCQDNGYFISLTNNNKVDERYTLLSGATFDPKHSHPWSNPNDSQLNRQRLAKALGCRPEALCWEMSRASVRMMARGRLPALIRLYEPAKDDVWLIGGLGSHGLMFAPLLARIVRHEFQNFPYPLPFDLLQRTLKIVTKATHCS